MTKTVTALITATSKAAPLSHQPSSVSNASTSTTGTNTALTLSTRRWIGALAAWASSTRRMMPASTVSTPVAVTCTMTRPSPLSVPPVTLSRSVLLTGSGSPVSMDSSTWVWPSLTRPSTAKRSPGRTASSSPTSTSSIGTSTSPSSPSKCAVSGRKACNARMAEVVWRLARASSHLPSNTSVITTAEASKYRCGMLPGVALSHSQTESAQPALVPMATSRSMLPLRTFSECQPAL